MNTDIIIAWLTDQGLTILFILILAVIAYRLLGMLTRWLTVRVQLLDDMDGSVFDKRTATVFRVIRSTGIVLIVATAVMMILTELGVSITPLLASVGIVSLALGLGAQTLVQDVISGLFILLENQYTVGDVIEVNGVIGEVERMSLRVTAVRDLYGTIHIVPNGEIRTVSNRTRNWSRAIVDVAITYEEDVDTAVAALNGIIQELDENSDLKDDLLETAQVTGVEGLEEWSVRLRIMVKTFPNRQWDVQRFLRRRIRDEFEQQGIALAFPRQTIQLVQPESR